MKYLHTMIRVSDPEETLRFFSLLGLREVRRMDNEAGRYTLIFLAAPGDEDGADRAHPQLGRGRLWRGPQFRPCRL